VLNLTENYDLALSKSEQRLKLALNAAKAGIWEWDLQTNENHWSDELWELYGLDRNKHEACYDSWLESVLPYARANIESSLRSAVLKGEALNLEWKVNLPDGSERWLMSQAQPVCDASGRRMAYRGIVIDITGRKKAEQALIAREKYLKAILHTTSQGFWVADKDGKIIEANEAYCRMSGYTLTELQNLYVSDLDARESHAEAIERIKRIIENGEELFEARHRRKDGSVYNVEVTVTYLDEDGGKLVVFCRDITGRKDSESEREIVLALLSKMNSANNSHELMSMVTNLMHEWSGCEAVGIRLRDGEDFPYFESRGFSRQFVQLESRLCEKDQKGDIVRDSAGNAMLECMCGNVIRGRFDPGLPFFTKNGSFWSNCTTELLASTSEKERQARTRNRCNGEGYESVALIPLRYGAEILGLLQFNDPRRGMFSETKISLLESLASQLAVGLVQRRTADKLRESEEIFSHFMEHSPIHVFFKDKDIRSLRLSRNYEEMLGIPLEKLLGKTMDELFPSELAKRMIADDKRVLDEGAVITFEEELNGRQYETIKFPINIEGKPEYLAGYTIDITEKKQVEEALSEARQLYESVFRLNPAAIVITRESDGLYLDANQAAESMTGYSRDEIIGHTSEEFGVWRSPEDRQSLLRQLHEKGFVNNLEMSFHKRSGDPLIVLMSVALVEIAGERRLIHIFNDFTEIKKAEDELKLSEEKHRMLLKALPDVVMRFDREARPLSVSENIEKFLNVKAEQLIGKTPREMGFPEDQCRFSEETTAKVFDSGDSIETEITLQGKNGECILNVRLMPEFDPKGNVKSVLGIYRDITDHRKVEHDYQTLFKEMLEGFALHEIICNSQGDPVNYRFLAVNPAFESLTGIRSSDIIGKTVLEVLPDIEPPWIETYGRVVLTGQPITFEDYSSELNKHFEVTAFRPAEGQFACIFSDITKRKKAEKEKAKLETQFQQAQKMESVGRLAGGVAHDFNNMLSVILGNVELVLMKTNTDDPIFGVMSEIRKAARRSADLTRQLLTFARKQVVDPKVIDLNQTIENMLKLIRRLIGEDIKLMWMPGGGLWTIKIDPSQVDQILANLCVNARDAIEGVGLVTIETKNSILDEAYCSENLGSSPGEYVQISVSDDGCGMSRDILDKLFEPFFTTKELGKGTGLGLSTIYGIVKQNNGFIKVYSEPALGTTFSIYLPRCLVRSEQEIIECSTKPILRGNETILLVEDEEAILGMVAESLKNLGYTVLTSSRPSEAIRAVETHSGQIHLLMTDVVMPEMNGRILAKNLSFLRPGLKTLFMSGYTADIIANRGVLDEGMHFIQKPFTIMDLANKVRKVLENE
jgi:two-component system, cell cycle sensor histidine kinase and response regulator CckA